MEQRIQIDFAQKKLIIVDAMQCDTFSRELRADMFCNGVAYDPKTEFGNNIGYRVDYIKKSNGVRGRYEKMPDNTTDAVTQQGTALIVKLAPAVLTAAGRVILNITIYRNSDNIELRSFPVVLNVSPAAVPDGEPSDDYWNIKSLADVTAAMLEMQEEIEELQQSGSRTDVSDDYAAQSTYTTPEAYLASLAVGRYVLTDAQGAFVAYADNDQAEESITAKPVSRITVIYDDNGVKRFAFQDQSKTEEVQTKRNGGTEYLTALLVQDMANNAPDKTAANKKFVTSYAAKARTDVSEAYASQGTYTTPEAYLGNLAAGAYILKTSSSTHFADNELVDVIVSHVWGFTDDGFFVEYVYANGTRIKAVEDSGITTFDTPVGVSEPTQGPNPTTKTYVDAKDNQRAKEIESATIKQSVGSAAAPAAVANFADGADDLPLPALSVAIDAPSPGVGSVTITRCGKNLFDKNGTGTIKNRYIPANSDTISSSSTARSIIVPCKPNTQYTVSKQLSSKFVVGWCTSYPDTGDTVYGIIDDNTATSITITTGAGAAYLFANVAVTADSGNYDDIISSAQVEVGGTATAYEAYNANSYTVQLGQSVTEGVLDVVNGKLTVGGVESNVTPAVVTSLLGFNNVFADSGDVWLTYKADATMAYNGLIDGINAVLAQLVGGGS